MTGANPPRPRALVTGASRGIGRQIALALAGAGHDVAFTARTLVEGQGQVPQRVTTSDAAGTAVPGSLQRTAEEVRERGVDALPLEMDLLLASSVRDAAAQLAATWGYVDVLVNNAVAHLAGNHNPVLELDLDTAEATMRGNYLHQVLLLQQILPAMIARGGGTVINICSGTASMDPTAASGSGGWGVGYAASKAAFGRLAGVINVEHRERDGIRAFNLDPGFVITEASKVRGGGIEEVAGQGFSTGSGGDAGRAVVWLLTSPEAERMLGRVVWTPKLVADIDSGRIGGPR